MLLISLFYTGYKVRTKNIFQKTRIETELKTARAAQMSIMPQSDPQIEGFDISGVCIPASEVGGDFFDYLSVAGKRIGIALADVSGKGLRGAMNAVMANGMLHDAATVEASCGKILSRLNAALYPRLEKQMFTALGLAILDQNSVRVQWASAAQPHHPGLFHWLILLFSCISPSGGPRLQIPSRSLFC